VSFVRECFLRLIAYVNRIVVIAVHVIYKRQIIVSVPMRRIRFNASFQMLNSQRILLIFEVCKAQIILNLWILLYLISILFQYLQLVASLERLNRLLVVLHFVKSHAKIEVSFGALRFGFVKLFYGGHLKLLPLPIF
jgi:hypothetical protein